MKRRLLAALRMAIWAAFADPAKLRVFRRIYGGLWSLWWIGCPVNSFIWLEGPDSGQRPGLGEGLFEQEWHS